ncbi:MAG: hypothetical protein D6690_05785 [Nitrospirae bacterium]|nr:MAG: hypothetical protein D6690_05785 [Nitrospirota bacterium]
MEDRRLLEWHRPNLGRMLRPMVRKAFILNLGKLLIATAWADGTLHQQEINALKELLFLLPDLSGQEWQELELYMTSPVSEEERRILLSRVLDDIRSEDDKDMVVQTLERLLRIEGLPQDQETMVVQQIRQDLEAHPTGLLATLSKPLRWVIGSRVSRYPSDGRESRLEDFIKQTIYFQLAMERQARGLPWSMQDEDETRKLCLAAGLLAHVASVDADVSEEECSAIVRILMERWQLSNEEAQIVARISQQQAMKGLDLVRLAKEFCARTTIPERRSFLRCLFHVANTTDRTSSDEIESIRFIAKALELSHQDFIDAKLSIPRAERGGL